MVMKETGKIIILLLILCCAIVLGISKGSVHIPLLQLFSGAYTGILQLRLSRVFLGILAGMGLGISGVVFQALLRNPLAEPYVLGVSSGAGLGAVVALYFGVAAGIVPLAAFLGAIVTIILVYNIAREGSKVPVQSLILLGVMVASLFSGLIVFLVSISSSEFIHSVIWWLLGSIAVFNVKPLIFVFFTVTAGGAAVFFLYRDLNAISLGEEEAVHLGIPVEHIKRLLFAISSLITASIVCVAGIIPFIGLIIPHMMRLIVGPNHRVLIPATAIGGAGFLIICDLISRTAMPPVELPIGVITSLIGGPIFIMLLRKRRRVR